MSKAHEADYMTIAMAREINDYEKVFHGVASPMPAVAIQLAKRLHAKNAVYLSIAGGVNARPSPLVKDGSTASHTFREGLSSEITLADIFDLSARGELDVAFLSGAQIDQEGRINLSAIGSFAKPKVRLPGGAGSAQLLPTVKRGILWKTTHDQRSLVENLDIITAAGRTDLVITPLCVFKRSMDEKLRLYSLFPTSTYEEVKENTGFSVEKHKRYKTFEPITKEEEQLLKEIDPDGLRFSEF